MSLKARRELLAAIASRYGQGTKAEKERILDEFVAATGYHRKYAINILQNPKAVASPSAKRKRQSRPRYYTAEVQAALITVWEATNRICSKRLVPFLSTMVEALERHGHLALSVEVKARLLAMSPATVDRLLASTRRLNDPHGLGTTKPGLLLKHQIPIRTFSEWDDHRPGFIEADLVAHCGDHVGGSYLNTLTMVDVATGWRNVWRSCFAIRRQFYLPSTKVPSSCRLRCWVWIRITGRSFSTTPSSTTVSASR